MSDINWPGLLQWSLKYSDGTSATALQMSEEDVKFLQNAIRNYLDEDDPTKYINDAKEKLNQDDEGINIVALDVIDQFVDYHPEIARNFHKFDLIDLLLSKLGKSPIITVKCLQIFSSVLANNDVVQSEFVKYDGLERLIKCMSENNPSKEIATAVLGAISPLIRNNSSRQKWFLGHEGINILATGIQKYETRFREKAMSLLTHLFMSNQTKFSHILDSKIIDNILDILSNHDLENEGIQHGEICAHMTNELIKNYRFNLIKHQIIDKIDKKLHTRLDYLNNFNLNDQFDVTTEKQYLTDSIQMITSTQRLIYTPKTVQ